MAPFDNLRWLYTAPCEVFFAFNVENGGEDIARKEVQFFLIEVSDPRLCKRIPPHRFMSPIEIPRIAVLCCVVDDSREVAELIFQRIFASTRQELVSGVNTMKVALFTIIR